MKNIDKKQSFDYELIAMTFHESGHALIAIHNYFYVKSVSVMTPKNKDGATDFFVYKNSENIRDEDLNRIVLTFELQAIYAGLAAEKIYYKDICGSSKFPMHLRIGSSYDIATASSIIRNNNLAKPGKNTYFLKKEIQDDVEQLLLEHWDAVKAIAHALYRKKRLTFDEIKYILIRRTEHKEFWKNRFKKIRIIHDKKEFPQEDLVKDLLLEDVIFSI